MSDINLVHTARDRLAGHVRETPMLSSPILDKIAGRRILVKAECLQYTGSFKFRGAWAAITALPEDQPRRGVIAFSSGNHAQGVAYAAKLKGLPACIIMPSDAPTSKIRGTRSLGADIVLYDREAEDRETVVERTNSSRKMALIRPFDDPAVISGQGTCGLEIAEQSRRAGIDDAEVLVPCGGGGLTSGISLALEAHAPRLKVRPCEPEGFDDGCPFIEEWDHRTERTGIGVDLRCHIDAVARHSDLPDHFASVRSRNCRQRRRVPVRNGNGVRAPQDRGRTGRRNRPGGRGFPRRSARTRHRHRRDERRKRGPRHVRTSARVVAARVSRTVVTDCPDTRLPAETPHHASMMSRRPRFSVGIGNRTDLFQYAGLRVVTRSTGMQFHQTALRRRVLDVKRFRPGCVGRDLSEIVPEGLRHLVDDFLVQVGAYGDADRCVPGLDRLQYLPGPDTGPVRSCRGNGTFRAICRPRHLNRPRDR